ncbi:MAG TPA: hypothetical protein VNT75_10245 [Symbiobacteriaceae bacterium]|nr:hypothetical protein [Symbiobacteriaceae bacterium]
MKRSIWTYPWDLHDVGLPTALGELKGLAGADGISLAVAYHAGRFVQPRSPRRKVYFPEDGAVYFVPDPACYGRIQPKQAEIVREQGDVLRALEAERERLSLRLNGWTVCLHNTRIGMLYPDVAVQNAFGDRYFHSLCPSHPDARAYLRGLVADLTHRYRLDSVELESPTFMGFGHGYHHEKDEVGLSPLEQFLLSLCFCEHCMKGARRAGVDVAAAVSAVALAIGAACERPVPSADAVPGGPEGFAEPLADFLRWRHRPVTSLLGEIREAAAPASQVYCLSGNPARAWQGGLDLQAAARALDGLVVLAYDQAPEQVAATVAAVRPLGGYLSVGLRLAGITGAAELQARIAAAERSGADGVNLYNYGLVPAARLAWAKKES